MINLVGLDCGSIPLGRSDPITILLQARGLPLMGHNLTMKQGLEAPSMVIVAIANPKVFNLLRFDSTSLGIGTKSILATTTICIRQGRITIEIDLIASSSFRERKLISTHLEGFFSFFHDLFSLLFIKSLTKLSN